MKVLLNYADTNFTTSQRHNTETALSIGGFRIVRSYGPQDIDGTFKRRHRTILQQRKGAGYWLWKPYLILRTLQTLPTGGFLVYCDAGAHFVASVDPILAVAIRDKLDVMVFEMHWNRERHWSKRRVFKKLGCEEDKYRDSPQRLAGFSVWRKSNFTMQLATELLHFTSDPSLLLDPVWPYWPLEERTFRRHRHDQSIFSLLTKKYGIPAYRDPSQWGNPTIQQYPDSSYGQTIELTRRMNHQFSDEAYDGSSP